MREVSGRAAEFLIEALEQRGIAPERLVEGLPIGLEDLRDSARRRDWALHVRLIERLEELIGTEELERVGSQSLRIGHMGRVRTLAGYMLRPQELYWMAAHWVGPIYFSHLRYQYEELGADEVRFAIEIPEGHVPCAGYFHINRGALRHAPFLLGMEADAEVDMRIDPGGRRAEFRIRPPRQRSLWGALRRLFGTSAVASEAVAELARQQRDLNRGFEELGAAERELEEQRGQLQALDALGQTLVAEIESHRLGEGLLEVLRERFGWEGAALWVSDPSGDEAQLVCASGSVSGRPVPHELRAAGRLAGRLDVWGRDTSARDPAAEELLGRMLPWIAAAVANAHAEQGPAARKGVEPFRWSGAGGAELFLIVDADGLVRYAGPGVQDILGVGQDEVVQQDIVELVHPDDLPHLTERFTSFGEAPGSATFAGTRLRHADGSWRVLEGVGIKVQDEHERPVYMFSASDVSFRRRAH
jgi:PAS domain S-box-containing protein